MHGLGQDPGDQERGDQRPGATAMDEAEVHVPSEGPDGGVEQRVGQNVEEDRGPTGYPEGMDEEAA